MRSVLFAAIVLMISTNAIASTVTLDFSSGVLEQNNTVTTQGYYFSGDPGVAWDDGGFFLGPDGLPGTINYPPGANSSMTTVSGGAFSLNSLDIKVPLPDPADDYLTITGNYANGGQVSLNVGISETWETLVFGAGWSNLTSVDFGATNGLGLNGVVIDNIVVSNVPVPAAAWLFGSALAGLGWLRRKKAPKSNCIGMSHNQYKQSAPPSAAHCYGRYGAKEAAAQYLTSS
jgi:hypothetical protein